MTQFLSENPAVTRGNGPGPWGRVLLVLLWAGLCVVPAVSALGELGLVAGGSGTPGTLRVVSCEDLGREDLGPGGVGPGGVGPGGVGPEARSRYDCRGWFTSDSGEAVMEVPAPPGTEVGDVLRARLTPEGDRAVPAGAKAVLAALTLPATGLAGLGFLPYVVMHWLGVRRGRRAAVTGGVLITAAGAALAVAGLVAAHA
ncbi:hypothetical protein ACFQYP_10275 [Nonomuraea antimicrobica]